MLCKDVVICCIVDTFCLHSRLSWVQQQGCMVCPVGCFVLAQQFLRLTVGSGERLVFSPSWMRLWTQEAWRGMNGELERLEGRKDPWTKTPTPWTKKYVFLYLFFCWITGETSPSLVGDWPLPCPASCGPPAVGRRFSCTPRSAPSSSWLGHSLPFQWHIASPHHIEPNALPPRRARDWKK